VRAVSRRMTLVLGIVLVVIGLAGIAVTAVLQESLTAFRGDRMSATRDMDAMFIEEMIPHHDDAIAMAELAISRAEHPEVRRLAESVKRTQTAENEQMRQWYREWYGIDVPAGRAGRRGMMGGMMGGEAGLERLQTADVFDKVFIEEMVPHHRMGVMMASMAGSATLRPEIRDLTAAIIESQSAEIDQMLEWYRAWYGR
jgi:uncharacterized protein (DUF305 family)